MKKTRNRKNLIIIISVIALILLLLVVFIVNGFSKELIVCEYEIEYSNAKASFRIAHISDLHDSMYGYDQSELIKAVRKVSPDVIMYTGDMTETYETDGFETLISALSDIPSFYVTGNHEMRKNYDVAKKAAEKWGVTVLDGDSTLLNIKGQKVLICGIDSIYDGKIVFSGENGDYSGVGVTWQEQVDSVLADKEKYGEDVYKILLSHRPDLVKEYKEWGFDLVLCGHAHGGQVRIPGLINGLFAPNQGVFPKYAGGFYNLGTTKMIVSRGLCKNKLPRFYNRPEAVIIDVGNSENAGETN